MTFAPKNVEAFLEHFDEVAPQIRSLPGCHHLELWRDVESPTVFTTYSHWENEKALDDYRESDLFRSTWADVKPLFADRPRAQSYRVARSSEAIETTRGDDDQLR